MFLFCYSFNYKKLRRKRPVSYSEWILKLVLLSQLATVLWANWKCHLDPLASRKNYVPRIRFYVLYVNIISILTPTVIKKRWHNLVATIVHRVMQF